METKQKATITVAKESKKQGKGSKTFRYSKPCCVKLLEDNIYAAKVERYRKETRDIRVDFLLKEKFEDKTANGLTKCVIAFLRLKGHQAERISTTGRVIDNRKTYTDVLGIQRQIGSVKWIPTSGTRGSADIGATIYGLSVKLEIKVGKDRQSAYQVDYQKQVESAGGIYLIVKDFTSFVDWYSLRFGSGKVNLKGFSDNEIDAVLDGAADNMIKHSCTNCSISKDCSHE